MLNRLTDYYRTHQRSIKKQLRTNYTRPIKDKTHSYQVYFIRELSEFKATFFQAKNLRFLGIFVILFWLYRDFAFAETPKGDSVKEGLNGTVDILNGVIFIVALVAQPIVMFIGWLLSPDWTFGEIIGLRPVIHQVWILVSNVVYFIFAIMLVVIALANIFGEHGGKTFALKAALPKLIMGVIMVPFTWFIVSATLSVTNVLTASVLSFSYDSIVKFQGDTNTNQDSFIDKKVIPSEIYIDLTEDDKGDKKKINCTKTPNKCLSLKDILGSANGAYNLLTYYAYEIFKIDQLKTLGEDQTGKSINKVGDIFKKLTFGMIFALIFAILIIAIAFALITRMVMLWLYAMFSPVFALSFFLGGGGGKGLEKLNKKMNIKAFISLAMVPVYVSAALSFGLILLSFAMNADFKQSEYVKISSDGAVDKNGEQAFTFKGGSGDKEIKLIIKGKYTEGSAGIAGNTFKAGQGIISNVIISFLALIILWMAVMAALGASEITEKAVKPIADFGDAMGKLMVEAPKYIPIKIPGKDGKSIGLSMAGLNTLQNRITGSFTTAAEKQATEFAGRVGLKGNDTLNASNEYKTQNPGQDLGDGQKLKGYVNHMKSSKDIEKLLENPTERKDFASGLAQYLNLTGENQKKFIDSVVNNSKTPQQLAGIIASSGASNAIIQGAFGSSTPEKIKDYLTSGKSDNSGGESNSTINNPKLFPSNVTVVKDQGKATKVTMNVNGPEGSGIRTKHIELDIKEIKVGDKVKTRDEIMEILKTKHELKGEGIDKIVDEIIAELNK